MKYKILIVEDNGSILDNTTELLELYYYTVLTTHNGKKGLDIALRQIPDLILSDIRMPFIDGYHLLELIRKQSSLNKSRFFLFHQVKKKKLK